MNTMNTPQIDDGGPAFPGDDGTTDRGTHYHGMTLRDWFAGQASKEDIAEYTPKSINAFATFKKSHGYPWSREWAKYRYADTMIAVRKLPTQP